MRLLRRDPQRIGQNKDIDLTRVGAPEDQIHVRLDVGEYLAVKEKASACHTSQGGGRDLRWVPRIIRRRILRHEHFVQAYPKRARRHNDLFDGLDLTV